MIHPQWAFFRYPGRRLTAVPKELEGHLILSAESHGLSVTRAPVFLFWSGSPRSPPISRPGTLRRTTRDLRTAGSSD
jgi:hypothetical protein